MEFEIREKIIMFCAKRASGKSRLLRYLFDSSKYLFSKTFVICPTEQVNHFYKDFVPSQNIFSTYKEEWVDNLINKHYIEEKQL